MKAAELRLGNYVLYASEGKQFKVCELSHGGIEVNGEGEITWIEIEEFEGIPLSEEWLKRFGFERHHNNKSLFVEQTQTGGVELMKDGTFEFCIGDIFFEVKYVHQLQNLYFALTGEELTLKEK